MRIAATPQRSRLIPQVHYSKYQTPSPRRKLSPTQSREQDQREVRVHTQWRRQRTPVQRTGELVHVRVRRREWRHAQRRADALPRLLNILKDIHIETRHVSNRMRIVPH